MGFGEEDHRSEVPFSSHHIKDMCHQQGLSLLLLTWVEVAPVRFLYSPPPILFSLEGSHYIEPTLEMHLTQAGLFGFPLPSIWNWDLEVLVSVQVLVA